MPQYPDDPSIRDADELWRRVPDQAEWWKWESDGSVRPSSAAFFDNRSGELSVHLGRLTTQDRVLGTYPQPYLAEILAEVPRSVVPPHAVAHVPEEGDGDDSHCLICPPDNCTSNERRKAAKAMAKRARFRVPPPSSS